MPSFPTWAFARPLALAAALLVLPAAAFAADAVLSAPASTVPEPSEAKLYLEARDAYDRAYAFFRDKEYAHATGELDVAIENLNRVIERSGDATLRNAAGKLLRRVASLRLSCTRRLDEARQSLEFVGPPAPAADAEEPAEDAEESEAEELPAIDSVLSAELAREAAEHAGEPAPPAIEVESNARVQKWLDYYTGRGRTTFSVWLRRSGLYMEWMKEILRSEGLPTDLVHLVFVESGFNPHARSRSHAVGPWQFMRGTAKIFGLQMDSWVDERRDPEKATIAAARYLRHLYGLFHSWPLALASYNAGEGTVMRAISRQGTKDFWSLRLPQQTRDYVPQFLAVLEISRRPEAFGFDQVEREARLAFDLVRIPGPVDLRAVADACRVPVDSLRVLNPAYLRHAATADRAGLVSLRVPSGHGDTLLEGIAGGSIEIPTVRMPKTPAYTSHKVRRGETMKSIAQRYGLTTSELAKANRLKSTSKLKRGRVLRIPQEEPRYVATLPKSVAAAPDSSRATPSASKKAKDVPVFGGTRTVRVKAGETLSEIAARYGTDVRTLRALNNLRPKQSIKAGARLKVPLDREG